MIALKARSDWPLKFQILFASRLWATRAGSAPKNIITATGINELKSPFCAILCNCFSIYKNNYLLQHCWLAVDIYFAASQLRKKNPPLWFIKYFCSCAIAFTLCEKEYSPAKTGGYPRISLKWYFPSFKRFTCTTISLRSKFNSRWESDFRLL